MLKPIPRTKSKYHRRQFQTKVTIKFSVHRKYNTKVLVFSSANQKEQAKPKNLNRRKKTLQPEKLKRQTKSKYQKRNIHLKQDTDNFQCQMVDKIYLKNGSQKRQKSMPK
jgi:hypothetical protein